MASLWKNHGIGVGLRPPHYPLFLESKPASVTWVELISENFMGFEEEPSQRPFRLLEKIRKNVSVMLHGVSLSVGSADPLSFAYLKRLKDLISRIEPEWVSDHLCWTGVDGENLHDLLPLPYTEEALALVCEKITQVQDFLKARILIENVSSYIEFEHSEMSEWEFLSEVAKGTDCGILLDVNNVYVSSVNHHFDPILYLKALPKDRIGQIHLAGHANKGSYLMDTHGEPVSEGVWELYRWAVKRFGPISTMVERDANIPKWEELEKELLKAASIGRGNERADAKTTAAFF